MFPGPIRTSLARDETFQRRPEGLPFSITEGPRANLSDPSGGRADPRIAYKGSRDLTIGPDTVHGTINYGIFMDRDKWAPHCTGRQMLNFIRAKTHSKIQVGVSYEAYSLSVLNSKLKHDINFLMEFDDSSAENLMDTFRLFGVQLNEKEVTLDPTADHFQMHHVARRARFPSYWSAIESRKNHRGSIRENDELWLLVRRYKLQDERVVKRPRLAHVTERIVTHYWQIVPYVSDCRAPPPECLYTDDLSADPKEHWVGGRIFVGYVHGVFGESRAQSGKHRTLARKALCPDSATTDDWKKGFYSLAEVEVFLATG